MCTLDLLILILILNNIIFVSSKSSSIPTESYSHYAVRLVHEAIDKHYIKPLAVMENHTIYNLLKHDSNIDNDIYINIANHQIKIYKPKLLQLLRFNINLNENLYLNSINPINLVSIFADSKSGQAFWRSNDGFIVLKTIKQYECKNLYNIINKYANHVFQQDTCLSGVLGFYRVKLNNGKKIYLLATRNVYPNLNIHQKYKKSLKFDLKGSTVGRYKSPTSHVYKDMDLLNSKYYLQLGNQAKTELLNILTRDSNFLCSCNFMDYSLLIDIEYNSPTEQSLQDLHPISDIIFKRFRKHLLQFTKISNSNSDKGKLVLLGKDDVIYHFGIIDFLQKYTLRKRIETFLKGFIYDWNKISCVSPSFYAKRFHSFINKYTE